MATSPKNEILNNYREKYGQVTDSLEKPIGWSDLIEKNGRPLVEAAINTSLDDLDYIMFSLGPLLVKRGQKLESTQSIVITPIGDQRRPFGAELIFPQNKPGSNETNEDTVILRIVDKKSAVDYAPFDLSDLPELIKSPQAERFFSQLTKKAQRSRQGKVMLRIDSEGKPVLPSERDLSGDEPVTPNDPDKQLRGVAQLTIDTLKDAKFDTLKGETNNKREGSAIEKIRENLASFENLILYLDQNYQ